MLLYNYQLILNCLWELHWFKQIPFNLSLELDTQIGSVFELMLVFLVCLKFVLTFVSLILA